MKSTKKPFPLTTSPEGEENRDVRTDGKGAECSGEGPRRTNADGSAAEGADRARPQTVGYAESGDGDMSDEEQEAGSSLIPADRGALVSTNKLAKRGLDLIRKVDHDGHVRALAFLQHARAQWNHALPLWESRDCKELSQCSRDIRGAYCDGLLAGVEALGITQRVIESLAPDWSDGWSDDPTTWTEETDVHLACATRLFEGGWLNTDIRRDWRTVRHSSDGTYSEREKLLCNLKCFLDEVECLVSAIGGVPTTGTKAAADLELGLWYANGEIFQKNDVEAVKWYREAATNGDPAAQTLLGSNYAHGEGVQQDDVQAVEWYRTAAEQGYALAQYELGWMYVNGRGVARDYVHAFQWWLEAAEQGQPKAQRNLAVMHLSGDGIARDCAEAHKWLSLAAMGASGEYQQRCAGERDDLAKRMTVLQLAESQKRVREWTERSSERRR